MFIMGFFQNKSPLVNENLKKCLNTRDGESSFFFCSMCCPVDIYTILTLHH